ncbi:NAD(P)/FAD-dependent oxidoreductase [Lichenicoccus sp.]|uniref:NAD(P)/FAD-dependent oxidoreductase n=1 Tax=Lichenicoccus sp. TaxID=2781899 RepID=UPI003D0AFAE8
MMATRFDVLVIGGGIAGISVAANLAAEVSVAVIEREAQPGYHSTGRSAALFSEIYGNASIRALSRGSRDFFFAPPRQFTDTPLVHPRGSLYIARSDQLESLHRMAALPDVAAGTRFVDAAEALKLSPLLREGYAALALYERDARDLEVSALHQGYLRQLRASGGRVLLQNGILSLEHSGGVWQARSGTDVIEAPIVINAAGAWAEHVGALAGAAPIGLAPCRRTVVLVEGPDNAGYTKSAMTIDIDEQFYFKPDAGLLLLSPADEEPMQACDVQPDELDVAIAIDRVQQATSLQVRHVRGKWAGLRSFVADRSPVVGFDPHCPGLFWLAGQGGYGIQTAPAMGRLAASLVKRLGVPDDLLDRGLQQAELSPERLDRKPSPLLKGGTQ